MRWELGTDYRNTHTHTHTRETGQRLQHKQVTNGQREPRDERAKLQVMIQAQRREHQRILTSKFSRGELEPFFNLHDEQTERVGNSDYILLQVMNPVK